MDHRWRSLPLVTKLTFERMLSFLFWIAVGTINFFGNATSPEKMSPFDTIFTFKTCENNLQFFKDFILASTIVRM